MPHKPESIAEWVIALRERFGGRPVAIYLEQARGSLVFALMKFEHVTLVPLNPLRLKSFCQAVCVSGTKDDPSNARLLVAYVTRHLDILVAWKPDDPLTREITLLVEQRRKAVELRKQLANRLRSSLKQSSVVLAFRQIAKANSRESVARISPTGK